MNPNHENFLAAKERKERREEGGEVGRVTPCAPGPDGGSCFQNGAHGVSRPTRNIFSFSLRPLRSFAAMAKLVFKRRRVRRVEFALPFAARALCWVLILLMSGLPGQMLGCICNNPDPCYGCRTKGGDPVDLGRMSVYIQDTELSPTVLPGARTPAALQFTRQYSGDMLDTNYGGAYTGPLGARWTHNYNVILTDKGSGSVEVRTWDGSVEVFATNTPGV